jgi:signal transduction histidine kinase
MRVLLIDDNPDDRSLALRVLEKQIPGLEAEEIPDPRALDQALERGGFDAVITDYQLLWTDGLTVLRRVKDLYPECPVVMFTGTGTEEVAVEAMKSGLDDYIVKKPSHYVRLPAALRSALARRNERRYTAGLEARLQSLLDQERAAREAAEAASLVKDEFLATLSHELRTPLNAIIGWTRLLRGGSLSPEKIRRAVETIERNALAQSRLIEDLLDVSAIVSGKMSLEIQPMDLAPVIEAALEAARPAAEAKGIQLEREIDPEAGPVPGDPGRLQQVVWNLLSNAVKFTPSGGLVRVALERRGSDVALTVSDTGVGIPPDFLAAVFEPFRQADSGTTRVHGGLGLGLAIVRRLVELHGGAVTVASEGPGRGASFTVRLPLQPRELERRAPGAGSPAARQDGLDCHPDLTDLRVLVVDDEADALELMTAVLEECGARVLAAHSVAEAREIFGSDRPDVLVSDIAMRGADGYELIRRVRELPPERGGKTPAVAVSAYARAEDRRRAFLAGFNLHLAKPYDPNELLTVVASLGGRLRR